jgi:tetratricopeptide (TPR) repeat protein
VLTGRPEVAVRYGQRAHALEADPRFDPFENGWSRVWEAFGHRYTGRIDTMFELCDQLAREPGLARVMGLVLQLSVLPGVGRTEEAHALAEPTMDAARALGNPYWIAYALTGCARAFAETDPVRSMEIVRDAIEYDRRQRLVYFEMGLLRDLAGLEAALGEPERALGLLDTAVERYHRAGNHASVASGLALVAVLFSRLEQPELAATVYGMSTPHGISLVVQLPNVLDELRAALGQERWSACATRSRRQGRSSRRAESLAATTGPSGSRPPRPDPPSGAGTTLRTPRRDRAARGRPRGPSPAAVARG